MGTPAEDSATTDEVTATCVVELPPTEYAAAIDAITQADEQTPAPRLLAAARRYRELVPGKRSLLLNGAVLDGAGEHKVSDPHRTH